MGAQQAKQPQPQAQHRAKKRDSLIEKATNILVASAVEKLGVGKNDFERTWPTVVEHVRSHGEEWLMRALKGEDPDHIVQPLKELLGYPKIGVEYYKMLLPSFKDIVEDAREYQEVSDFLAAFLDSFDLTGERSLVVIALDTSGSMQEVIKTRTPKGETSDKQTENSSRIESAYSWIEALLLDFERGEGCDVGKMDLVAFAFGLGSRRPQAKPSAIQVPRFRPPAGMDFVDQVLPAPQPKKEGRTSILTELFFSSSSVEERGKEKEQVTEKEKENILETDSKRQLNEHGDLFLPAGLFRKNPRRYIDEMKHNVETRGFGETPLAAGLYACYQRIRELTSSKQYGSVVLIIVSDGVPNPEDNGASLELANRLKHAGATLVTCFFAASDVVEEKMIFSREEPSWSEGAKLMFKCASALPRQALPARFQHAIEEVEFSYDDPSSTTVQAFAQVNHSGHLRSFLDGETLLIFLGKQ